MERGDVKEGPRYKHDCEDGCAFLGRYHHPSSGREFDLYSHIHHGTDKQVDILARYGDDGQNYHSTTPWVIVTYPETYEHTHPLVAAYHRHLMSLL